jgi:hypothetical protein
MINWYKQLGGRNNINFGISELSDNIALAHLSKATDEIIFKVNTIMDYKD